MATELKVTSVVQVGNETSKWTWDKVNYKQLSEIELKLIQALKKLNDAGFDQVNGVKPAVTGDDSVRTVLVYEFTIEKADGSPYHRTRLEYFNIPEFEAMWMKGILGGELKDHEKRAKKEKFNKRK